MFEKLSPQLIQNSRYYNSRYYNSLSPIERIQFANNLRANGKYNSVNDYCRLNSFNDFYEFIANAFSWMNSKEGTDYWHRIAHHYYTDNDSIVDDNVTIDTENSIIQQQLKDLAEENQRLKLELFIHAAAAKIVEDRRKPDSWNDIYTEYQIYCEHKASQRSSSQHLFEFLSEYYEPPYLKPLEDEANQAT